MPRDSHRREKRRERSRSRSGSRRKNRSRRKRSDSISASPNHRRGGSVKREVESPRPERPEVRRDSSPEEDGRRAEREVSPPSSPEPAVKDEPGSPRRNGEVADASPRPSPDPEDDVDRKPDIPVERSRSPEKRRRSSDRRERRRDDSRRRRRSRSRDHDGRRGSRSRGKDRRHRRSGEKESRKLPRLVKEDVPAPRRLERSGSHYTPPPRAESDIRTYDDVEYEDDRRSESPEPPRLRSTVVIPDRLPPQEPKVRKKEPDMITTRTGGAYIPPAKLRLMQDQIADKSSVAFQRLAWEALKKSINGLVNKVNVTNLGVIVRELIKENLVRGRGLFCRAIMQAQLASPTFTHVYAGLTAVINTKFPNIGELLLRRLVIQFRRGYKSNNKQVCMNSSRFIAHLVNQQVAHEILALEIVTLLLEKATDDSVEVAIGFLKECGQKLDEVSPKGLRAVSERMRHVLHEGEVAARTQYLIESCFATIKDKFKDHPAVIQELDLVEDDDQYTHFLSLDDEGLQTDDILNVFREDSEFQDNEEKYRDLKREILGDTSSEESGSGSSGSDSSSSEGEDEEEEEGEEGAEKKTEIVDNTETNLIALRRLIYLTIQSSLDFEECAHKLRKLELKPGQEVELCHMILDCCAQQRTYEKFYGLLAQRFCELNKMYVEPFQTMFGECYETCHRFDTNRLRHVAKLFAHLLFTDAISWGVLGQIRLDAENTTSSKRIFIKILFQELVEYMGLQKLHGRINDPTLQEAFRELFPRDDPQATMFAINFFTSIGLGGLTEELREQFKSMTKKPKPPPAAPVVVAEKTGDGEGSSSSSSLSSMSSSSSSSSSDEDGPKKKRRRKDKSKKKTKKTKKRRGSDVSSSESSDEEVKDKKRKKKSERKKASPAKEEEEGGFMGRKGDYWEQIERRRREMEEVARKKALGSMEGRRKDWDRPSLSPPPVNVRKDSDRRRPPSPKRRREDKLPSPRRRKSPSPRGGRRSLSPERKRPKSPARRRRDEKSPSPRRREARSPSPRGRRRSPEHRKPPRGRSASKSPPRKRSPAKSPPRRRSPSKSPPRRKSQSKSPTRKRSVAKSSPKRRSPSKSPPRRRPRHDSDSSPSPRRPRQGENGDRGRKRQHSPSDTSPERPRKKSPPKKTNKREDKSSSSSSSTSSASSSSSEESEEDSPPPPKERRREDSEKGKDKRRSPPARRRRRS